MTAEESPRLVKSAVDLLALGIEIEGVQFFRLQAEVNEDALLTDGPDEIAPAYGLKLRHEGLELGTRISVTLDQLAWKIVVDAAVNYKTAVPVQLDREALLDFANRIGVMALLPYLRQAIADLSQRVLGEVVLMPVIPPGGLVFTMDDAVD